MAEADNLFSPMNGLPYLTVLSPAGIPGVPQTIRAWCSFSLFENNGRWVITGRDGREEMTLAIYNDHETAESEFHALFSAMRDGAVFHEMK